MCVCANISFADLIALACRERLELAQVAARTGATRGCGLCRTYVIDALASGQSSFPARPL